jgi:hypothetical protein
MTTIKTDYDRIIYDVLNYILAELREIKHELEAIRKGQ